MKWRIRVFFSIESLKRILRIPLRLKCSSWCEGSMASKSGSQRPSVVVGGGKMRFQGLGGILEKRRVKSCVFHVEERIYNPQILLSELISLSQSPFFALSARIWAQHNRSALGLTQRAKTHSVQFPLGLELRLARPCSLSAIPSLVGIALSMPFSLSAHYRLDQKLLFSKSQRSDCGKFSQEAPDKM